MKIDFHVHTKYSVDSLNEPREIAAACRKLGVIPAITDHSSISSFREFRSLGFKFIPGEECYTEERFDLTALFLTDFIPKKKPFAECLDIIKSQGALSYLPHMCDTSRHGSGSMPGADRVDIIEVFNARCMASGFNQKAFEFAKKNKKPMGAGSDAHFIFEIGNAYVEIQRFHRSVASGQSGSPDISSGISVCQNASSKRAPLANHRSMTGGGREHFDMEEFDLDNPKALLKALKEGKITGNYAPVYVRGTTSLIKFAKRAFKF